MRLSLGNNHRTLKHRMLMLAMRLTGRHDVPDVVRLLTYRTEFFGASYSRLLDDVLRGKSEWSLGHRELFAAFTAEKNACTF